MVSNSNSVSTSFSRTTVIYSVYRQSVLYWEHWYGWGESLGLSYYCRRVQLTECWGSGILWLWWDYGWQNSWWVMKKHVSKEQSWQQQSTSELFLWKSGGQGPNADVNYLIEHPVSLRRSYSVMHSGNGYWIGNVLCKGTIKICSSDTHRVLDVYWYDKADFASGNKSQYYPSYWHKINRRDRTNSALK